MKNLLSYEKISFETESNIWLHIYRKMAWKLQYNNRSGFTVSEIFL